MEAAIHTRTVRVGKLNLGGAHPLVLIAGPCVIQTEAHALRHAERISQICRRLRIPYIFKASYDKANRTSRHSFRGVGLRKGLAIMKRIKHEVGVPVLSDIHCREEVAPAAQVLDVLQIPAFLSRQTDLLVAAAKSGRAVNIKKGQFLAPWDMAHAVEKVVRAGNRNVFITERGVSFGYNNLVSDFRALPLMRSFQVPVIFDATHSVQLPGGAGRASSGQRQFVPALARAAAAVGCDGIFMEVHEDPDRAPSDGPNMVPLKELERLLTQIVEVDRAYRRTSPNGR